MQQEHSIQQGNISETSKFQLSQAELKHSFEIYKGYSQKFYALQPFQNRNLSMQLQFH